jgi:hypothetical protein
MKAGKEWREIRFFSQFWYGEAYGAFLSHRRVSSAFASGQPKLAILYIPPPASLWRAFTPKREESLRLCWSRRLRFHQNAQSLLLPGRIDKVINAGGFPSFLKGWPWRRSPLPYTGSWEKGLKARRSKPLAALSMNTAGVFCLLCICFSWFPTGCKRFSVISAVGKFIPFFVTQNLLSSLLLYLGYQFKEVIFRPIKTIEQKIMAIGAYMSKGALPALKTGAVVLMLGANVVLELLL